SSRGRHTRSTRDWSSDVCSSDLETVLWPLRYPDSFTRLGIEAPKGVLLHGPPGTGKTFLVRALAGTGALNVFTVKGSELMNRWVDRKSVVEGRSGGRGGCGVVKS